VSFVNSIKTLPLAQISKKLEIYEMVLSVAENKLTLEGKELEEAIKTHPVELVAYNLMLQECKTIEHMLQARAEEIEGNLYRHYIEQGGRALGAKELAMYVKSDPKYVEVRTALVEVDHIKRSLEAVVGALETLGWSLTNIVKTRIESMQHVLL
jgi:hypothetical protein